MSGVKGKSGRKKVLSTLINEAIDAVRQDLPEIFRQLKDLALSGDREACIYLVDRAIGKPKQQTDIELTGTKELGAGLIIELFKLVAEERKKLFIADNEGLKSSVALLEGSEELKE